MIFLTLLIVPLLIGVVSFIFLKGITWKEFILQLITALVVAGLCSAIIYSMNTGDTEVWNGWVVSKKQVWTSCSHSYPCNPHEVCSGSGKDKSCTTQWDTCYEHSNDWNWEVYTSNDETITIDRVDGQGVYTPPRWASVTFGEPTAQTHSYTSYIKAAPGTLFRHQGIAQKYTNKIPKYPLEIYDYYKINRIVGQGVSPSDPEAWNRGLEKTNSDLGKKKQVNILVVMTTESSDWYYALEEAWIGGKKNDVVLVVGVETSTGKPTWARVMAWTTNTLFNIKLRDDIMSLQSITPDATLKILHDDVQQYYKRKPMADFEYLKASIVPTPGEYTITIVIELILSALLAWFFNIKDVFGDEERSYSYYGRRRF